MENVKPFKEMNFQEKKRHIIDYYKWHILITIVVIGCLTNIIYNMVTAKDQILGVLFVNYIVIEDCPEDADTYFTDFVKENGYDPDKSVVNVNTSMLLDPNSEMSYQQMDALEMLFLTNMYSAFFSEKDTFLAYAKQDTFDDLRNYVSEDTLKKYGDYVVYNTSPVDNFTYPCGVILTKDNCKWLAENQPYDTCYFGVCVGADHKELTIKFAQYILNER